MALLPDITDFYGAGDEATRLTSGRTLGTLELLRTRELLRSRLPAPPASVLDVGGGPGVHARWLMDDGYRVVVVDPVERHVRQARAQGLTALVGDARQLEQPDGYFDAVLLLGPLYHLPDARGRARAWQEAHRVLKPGGLVAAAAINRYIRLLDLGADDGPEVATTGFRVRRDGPTSYCHGPEELGEEAAQAGLTHAEVFGVQGPASAALMREERRTGRKEDLGPEVLARAMAAARCADSHPALAVTSVHLLVLACRPSGCPQQDRSVLGVCAAAGEQQRGREQEHACQAQGRTRAE
ncbi:class I SAM-dependent methyltransferase [Streptomyces sp. NPDC096339]|uniref:class I SAM-dependent methyltransferase n=1 Tax=Streptomyces sp. NPDC096339 TaxID=3366086 RepID=UPI0037FA9778